MDLPWIHTHTRVSINTHIHHAHIYIYTQTHYVYVCSHMYNYAHTQIYVCMHTHTHTHIQIHHAHIRMHASTHIKYMPVLIYTDTSSRVLSMWWWHWHTNSAVLGTGFPTLNKTTHSQIHKKWLRWRKKKKRSTGVSNIQYLLCHRPVEGGEGRRWNPGGGWGHFLQHSNTSLWAQAGYCERCSTPRQSSLCLKCEDRHGRLLPSVTGCGANR